ncbi:MAG: hypothetical protein WCA51_00530, partial [Dehalococcoidia bacterium]
IAPMGISLPKVYHFISEKAYNGVIWARKGLGSATRRVQKGFFVVRLSPSGDHPTTRRGGHRSPREAYGARTGGG